MFSRKTWGLLDPGMFWTLLGTFCGHTKNELQRGYDTPGAICLSVFAENRGAPGFGHCFDTFWHVLRTHQNPAVKGLKHSRCYISEHVLAKTVGLQDFGTFRRHFWTLLGTFWDVVYACPALGFSPSGANFDDKQQPYFIKSTSSLSG